MHDSTESELIDSLLGDFVPVYGTELSRDSFHLMPGTSVVNKFGTMYTDYDVFVVRALDEKGVETKYALWNDWEMCSADAVERGEVWQCLATHNLALPVSPLDITQWEIQPIHPYERTRGKGATFADWASAIMIADAQGVRQAPTTSWEEDSLEAALQRVEMGIGEYSDESVASRVFATPDEMQGWLNEQLSSTQLRVEVDHLARYPLLEGRKVQPGMVLMSMSGEDPQTFTYAPAVVSTSFSGEKWISGVGGYRPRPHAAVWLSGPEIIRSEGDDVLSWSELSKATDLRFGEDSYLTPTSWALIRVLGTDMAIPVPVGASHIHVHIDGDGSLVEITVLGAERQARLNRLEDAFNRKWGKWLDRNVELTAEELREGRERVEREMRDAIEAERKAK